jgi:hypothetical protein
MYSKTTTYVDYNGQEATETFLFNLSKAELMEWEMSENGGLIETLEKITKANDKRKLMEYFKKLVLKSYGVKAVDGKRFIKNDEVREAFEQHPAFSDIFVEFATDAKSAAAFVKGIIPADLNEATKSVAPAAQ